MKPLVSGQVLHEVGCEKVVVKDRVGTIEWGPVILYKYTVYTETFHHRYHHVAWQMFVDGVKVREHVNCQKFMTKQGFKELCQNELTEHFKNELNIAG